MIKQIIAMLKISDFYGVSENIDIAKGKYKIPKGLKDSFKITTRKMTSKKYKNGGE
jgi:hypothetical protein